MTDTRSTAADTPPVMTSSLQDDLTMEIVEIARLLEQDQEFEATEKAKIVCETLDALEQNSDVEEIRNFMNEATNFHLAA